MAKKVFRIGGTTLNLPFVMKLDKWPAQDWGEADERKPRLLVSLLTGSSIEIVESQAVAAGFADIDALEAALFAALDALD